MDRFRWVLHDPDWLWCLLLLPFLAWLRSRRPSAVLTIPHAGAWYRDSVAWASRWPEAMMYGGLALLVVALARPQQLHEKIETKRAGYDLMLVVDLSKSMWAEDYIVNGRYVSRINMIRPVVQAFIENRPDDRIGLVVFSGRAYTLSPLTHDHSWLARQAGRLDVGMLENGTAMGEGLATALERLEDAAHSRARSDSSAFVVLLCDGANNLGAIEPKQAAAVAVDRGVPVFTIGAGKEGFVRFPAFNENAEKVGMTLQRSDLDEPTLMEIAEMTGGQYFRADEADAVQKAFDSIDQATKIEFQATNLVDTREWFWVAAVLGTLLVCAAFVIVILQSGETIEVMDA